MHGTVTVTSRNRIACVFSSLAHSQPSKNNTEQRWLLDEFWYYGLRRAHTSQLNI